MFNHFVQEAREVVADAQAQARALGSPTIEAEHVLLALSRDGSGIAGEVLGRAGLDHATLVDALESEFSRSLAAVGVSAEAFDLPSRVGPVAGRPRFGTSAKSSLERALEAALGRGDHRIEPAHVLLGVLDAREGTVPRALRGVGVEPADLAAETHAALSRA